MPRQPKRADGRERAAFRAPRRVLACSLESCPAVDARILNVSATRSRSSYHPDRSVAVDLPTFGPLMISTRGPSIGERFQRQRRHIRRSYRRALGRRCVGVGDACGHARRIRMRRIRVRRDELARFGGAVGGDSSAATKRLIEPSRHHRVGAFHPLTTNMVGIILVR